MTDQEKFNYAVYCLANFIGRNKLEPYTDLEKEAFYYEMLLLSGPVEKLGKPLSGSYKPDFGKWIHSLVMPWCHHPDDAMVLGDFAFL